MFPVVRELFTSTGKWPNGLGWEIPIFRTEAQSVMSSRAICLAFWPVRVVAGNRPSKSSLFEKNGSKKLTQCFKTPQVLRLHPVDLRSGARWAG